MGHWIGCGMRKVRNPGLLWAVHPLTATVAMAGDWPDPQIPVPVLAREGAVVGEGPAVSPGGPVTSSLHQWSAVQSWRKTLSPGAGLSDITI